MAYIKFKSTDDIKAFLVEAGLLNNVMEVTEDFDPNSHFQQHVMDEFARKRKALITGLVDFRRSQITKKQWRENRWKYMTGIHSFHRSIAGKRLHRTMSRFLTTTIFDTPTLSIRRQLQGEALTAISSLKTHLYIEQQYYRTAAEDVNFEVFRQYAVPLLSSVETKATQELFHTITNDELELMLRLTECKELLKELRKVKRLEELDHIKQVFEDFPSETLAFSRALLVSSN